MNASGSFAKRARYGLEACALGVFFAVFFLLPLDAASAAGGWIGRTVGPRLAVSRKARRNIGLALPDLDAAAREAALRAMWDNLGRVMAEYPHLEKIGRTRVRVEAAPESAAILAENRSCMLVSAHMANWEIAAAAMLARYGRAPDLTYRAPNNPWTDRLLMRARTLGGRVVCHPKSRDGARSILAAVRDGRTVAMLIDQKYNGGIAAPFFGRPAMTNPVFAQLCRRYDRPLIPARIERTGGAHFTVTLDAPVPLSAPDGEALPIEDILIALHARLESWIRARPGQWLWLHRRWG